MSAILTAAVLAATVIVTPLGSHVPGAGVTPALADQGGAAYQQQVLADGADLYYAFDGASSSGGVFSGAGPKAADLTESSGWSAGPELLSGTQVSGSSSVIPGPTGGSTTCCRYAGPFSWSAWIEVPPGQSAPSFAGLVDAGNYDNLGFTVDWNNGQLEFVTIWGGGSSNSTTFATYGLQPGVPVMVAVTFDGTTGTIYANGHPLNSGPMGTPAAGTGTPTVLVGAYHSNMGGYSPWTGDEDSVAFFPSALSSTAIANEYAAGAPPVPPASAYQTRLLNDGADAYFSFDGAASSTSGVFAGAGPRAGTVTESSGWSAGPELASGAQVAGASSVTPGTSGGTTSCCRYGGPFSWSGWVEVPPGATAPSSAGFVDASNYFSLGFTFSWSNGQLQFVTIASSTNYTSLFASYALRPGTRVMLAVTYDGTKGTIWADGVPLVSGAMVTPSAGGGASSVLIGAYHSNTGPYTPWTGYEDDVAFFPAALSASTMAAEYQLGGQPVAPPATAYQRQVLSDGADAYFPLDRASTSQGVFDGYGPHAGTVGESAGWQAGPELLSTVTVPSAGSVIAGSSGGTTSCCIYSGAFSWSGWIEVPSGQSIPSFGGLVDAGNYVYGGFDVVWNNGSLELVTIANSSQYSALLAPYTLRPGVPVMVAVTFNGTTGTIYANGQALASSAMVSPTVVPNPVLIGAYHSNNGSYLPWAGDEDSVAFFPTALSAAGISRQYQVGLGQLVEGPIDPHEHLGGCGCSQHPTTASYGQPVDTATGNFWHTFDDLAVPGRGIPLHFTHTYNSATAGTSGPLGYGWTDSYNLSLTIGTGGSPVTVNQENGSQSVYTLANGAYLAAPRVLATLTHNVDGTWTFVRDAQETFQFDASGRLTAETDRNDYATTVTWPNGSTQVITDPAGRTLTIAYNAAGLISSVTDGASRTVAFAYGDGAGNLTDVTEANGGTWHFTYDAGHRLLTMLDPNQRGAADPVPLSNTYDSSGRVVTQVDSMGRSTTFDYTSVAGATKVTDPKGNVTVYAYSQGELVSKTVGYGTSQAATWNYAYDPIDAGLASVTDPDGHTTITTYDAAGNVLTRTDRLGRTTTRTYNSVNEPLTLTDPKGITTTFGYDNRGNLLSRSAPLDGTSQTQTVSYTYGDAGHPGDVTAITDADGKASTFTYDAAGDVASQTDPLGHTTISCYDSIGRRTELVQPKGSAGFACPPTPPATPTPYTSLFTYDPMGDALTVTDPLGHQTVNTYDADRDLTGVTDPDANATTYVYDLDNERTQTKRADTPQTTVTTDYNPDATVADQKDGKGNAIQTYAYDPLARVTRVTDALGNATAYSYDGTGNQVARQDPGGNCSATPKTGCTTYTYDVANQLAGVAYSDGTTPNVSNITYDADGQRTGMTDGTGTSSWAWDSLHRLTSYTDGAGAQLQWSYDLRNQPTAITYPGSHVVTRAYDDAGRLTAMTDWLTPSSTTWFGYDADSNLTTETFPSSSGAVDSFSFDGADQLDAITDTVGSSTVFSATYGRDQNGEVTADSSVPTSAGSYGYTPLNQLCYAASTGVAACSTPPSGATGYAYDAADNLTQLGTTTQAFNAGDELCWTVSGASTNTCGTPPTGATTYTYDTRGNRTLATPPVGSATSLGYDQADRLISDADGSGSTTYAYDGDGQRTAKTNGTSTTRFLWEPALGGVPLLAQETTGSNTTSYIYGPGGLPLEQITSSGATLFFHHDQLGSTRVLTDASGAVQATYTYDAFGNQLTTTGAATNPLLYAGQYHDAESGFYYLRARYYDPSTSQFLSRDPASAKTGEPYGYAVDNPLNMVDPTGLDSWGNDTGMCGNPADRTSNIPCDDARAFYSSCSGGSQHDQLNCEAENYYDEYFRAYTMLQNIYQQGTASLMDPKCLNDLVAHELHGIWGDIYVDNTKSKVLPGVHESAADEDKVHLFGPFYYPWDAPGVHANGTVDFYNQAGPHPLKLSDFKDVNG